jgi:hypothetical protein
MFAVRCSFLNFDLLSSTRSSAPTLSLQLAPQIRLFLSSDLLSSARSSDQIVHELRDMGNKELMVGLNEDKCMRAKQGGQG